MTQGNNESPSGEKEDRVNRPVPPLRVGSNRAGVNLELIRQGRDFLLLVTGGTAHVGAVAVWDSGKMRGPASVSEMSGHREGRLALDCAEILGRASGRTVVAVVGIHQDDATRQEIEAIVANVRLGVRELASSINQEPKDQK